MLGDTDKDGLDGRIRSSERRHGAHGSASPFAHRGVAGALETRTNQTAEHRFASSEAGPAALTAPAADAKDKPGAPGVPQSMTPDAGVPVERATAPRQQADSPVAHHGTGAPAAIRSADSQPARSVVASGPTEHAPEQVSRTVASDVPAPSHAAETIHPAAVRTADVTPVQAHAAAPAASAQDFFDAGDLVLSIYGNGDGSGSYGDNQAAPIVLQELTTDGTVVRQMTLSQNTTVTNGVTNYAVSGEYGSSSEGTLSLSADGHSLVIAGYAINAATYNAGGASVYGNAALAQSTSVQGGQYTPVARVIANIRADGSVDSSTALYGVDNTNNPRSVATVDGSSFYLSGQGVKGDTTQGVFYAKDGASSATAIDNSTDTRTVEIANGTLYVSRDSKQGNSSSISSYGGLPQGATTATVLPGLSGSVKLASGQANSINASAVGTKINLSPENFFLANATTMYVADSGLPKTGSSLGDGGLQKWSLVGGSWTLDYTLSQGLNLVTNKSASGTTGLIGLAGKVTGDQVTLYATNATIGDLDQTYLYGIADTLSATSNTGASFTVLKTTEADTNIRGVAFAPSSETACYVAGTMILTDRGERPVETLVAGDVALVPDGTGFRDAPIVWVGERRIDLERHAEPEHVRPIRFAPGAIAENVPSRPFRVSPDHALLLDGVLIAARQLVNGVTITVEPVPQVHYVHVELDRHDILLADNVPAESFLDTGNRTQFAGSVQSLHPRFDRTAHPGACAPMAIAEEIVEPIHRRLAERAGACAAAPNLTSDPGLTLRLPDGNEIVPVRAETDGRYVFWLDAGAATTVVLRSRRQSPASLRPWLDDRRLLGVGIAEVRAWTHARGLDPVALTPDRSTPIEGWWPAGEGDPVRWTDGAAVLNLPAGCVQVEIAVAATMEYALSA